MRENTRYKFRAWNKRTKMMEEDFYIRSNGSQYDLAERNYDTPHIEIEKVELEIMQYTGLEDKHGLGIFEKDIVKITVDDGFNYIDSVGFVDWHEKEREYAIFLGGEPWRRLSIEDEIEVIGDIYQNKDLI